MLCKAWAQGSTPYCILARLLIGVQQIHFAVIAVLDCASHPCKQRHGKRPRTRQVLHSWMAGLPFLASTATEDVDGGSAEIFASVYASHVVVIVTQTGAAGMWLRVR